MRISLVLAILFGATSLAVAQPEKTPPQPRFGVAPNLVGYPQANAKDALNSAIRAIEREKYDYLAAHLLDAKFVDARVADRAKLLETAVDQELRTVRENQRKDSDVPLREQLPSDPALFADVVKEEARNRAFKFVIKDIRQHLTEHPEYLKDFKRFLRDGQFTDGGDSANATLRDLKDKQLNFKKVANRWYVEDRQGIEQPEKK